MVSRSGGGTTSLKIVVLGEGKSAHEDSKHVSGSAKVHSSCSFNAPNSISRRIYVARLKFKGLKKV